LREGEIKSYEISERDRNKGNSHTRGIISLNLPDMKLMPGDFRGISFRIKVKMIFVKSYWKERVFGYLATSMYLRKEKLPL